jgi:Carboxypeptidase regulatory-like domain
LRLFTKHSFRKSTLIIFASMFALTANAQQMGTAVLNGIVTDPQGAVVKAAHVTARQNATSVERTTNTNGEGIFVFNDLMPGSYEVRVEAAGFASFVAPVSVEVGQQAKLKATFGVETAKTSVEVQAEAQQVNTVSSVVDGVVNAHQIDNLPLNGRNFLELALLMPGNTIALTSILPRQIPW